MTDNIISFEEFRLEKKKAESENDPIMQILKKDLREQKDLVDWYLFHSSFKFLMSVKSTLSQAAQKKH